MDIDGESVFKAFIIAVCAVAIFLGIAVFVGNAFTNSWKRECDNIGTTIVDDSIYRCQRVGEVKDKVP